MNYDHIFIKDPWVYEAEYPFDPENRNPLTILFEKEGILLRADPQGNAVFCNLQGEEICRGKADGKDRYFTKIYCRVTDNAILVRFPRTKWVDNYPHCDGEYDRWDEITIENILITCDIG